MQLNYLEFLSSNILLGKIVDHEYKVDDDNKFYKELLRQYSLAKLRKNKVEMSKLEQQLKVYRNSSI